MTQILALFFDGTWQTLSQAEPTNIARLAQAVTTAGPHGSAQTVWYDPGVGADPVGPRRGWRAGALGAGLEAGLVDAYRFLILNAAPADQIFIFGFSRGAWAARSLAGWLGACGLPGRTDAAAIRQSWEAYRKGAQDAGLYPDRRAARAVRFLGCFDTVGRLGVPDLVPGLPLDLALNRDRRFHDVRVGSHVRTARHACALDETRRAFALTPMSARHDRHDVAQRWFIGSHGAVGGGEPGHRPLADIALAWMVSDARRAGLDIKRAALDLQPGPLGAFKPPRGVLRWMGRHVRCQAAEAWPHGFDPSVAERMAADPDYRPAGLCASLARCESACAFGKDS